jgi:putative transposase
MIDNIHQQTGYGIRLICHVLALPRSSYYHAATPSERQLDDAELSQTISKLFHQHMGRYGVRRVCATLREQGITVCADRVRRLMKEAKLKAYQPRTFVPRTSDGRADSPSPNLLLGRCLPAKPNEVWVSDFTYIPCGSGYVYLCVVMDLCSRRIVGWSLADHMRAELVADALSSALASRRFTQGMIFHSDRGSQYASKAFRKLLDTSGMRQSMSARANPYHNAWSESVIGTLKAEMLRGGHFMTLADARLEISAYIDGYYNTQRIHSSLKYLSPSAFEIKIAAAA